MHGLQIAFSAAIVMCLIAAGCSALRGGRYVRDEEVGEFGAPLNDDDDVEDQTPISEEWVPA